MDKKLYLYRHAKRKKKELHPDGIKWTKCSTFADMKKKGTASRWN